MSDERKENTVAVSEAIGEFPAPSTAIDLEAAGAEYLNHALRESAIARWNHACPEKLKTTDFQDQRLARNAERCREIIAWQYQPTGVLASGPSGAGKTRAMWQLMKRFAEEGRECRYFTAAEWFTVLQYQVVFGRDESLAWIKSLARVPIVFIDDLGQEAIQASRQDWAQGWLFQFLDMRLGNGLPLFVTTNLTAKEMAGNNADTRANPLIRRLLELCSVIKFES